MQKLDVDKPIEKAQDAVQQAARAETAPPHERRYRIVLFQTGLIGVLIVFAVLAFFVSTNAYFPFDLKITLALQSINFPIFATLITIVSWPGYMPGSAIIVVLIFVSLFGLGLRWEACVAIFATIFDQVTNNLVKILIARPRPGANLVHVVTSLNSYSFPSGHVTFYTGFFGFLLFLTFSLLKKSWKRTLLLVIFGTLILLIGLSRIYLGEHWTSDVIGAYLLGTLALVVNIQFYRWGKSRYFVKQPVAPEK